MTAKIHSIAASYANYSPDWWTPSPWMSWVTRTLRCDSQDEIFDPCPRDWQPGDPSGAELESWGSKTYVNHPGDKRGGAQRWFDKYLLEQDRQRGAMLFVWCAFSIEQFRHLRPSPLELPGWIVAPRTRTKFIWGGPDIAEKRDGRGKVTRKARKHGEAARSPGNWAVFWTNTYPATPPTESIIWRTA